VADGVLVALHPLEQALFLQRLLDRLPGGVAGQAGEAPAVLIHHRRLGEDVDGRQVVAGGDLEVVGVVGGRDLDGAAAEVGIDGVVGHHRDLPPHQGQDERAPDGAGVAGVGGMDGHGRVPEHGLGPGGGHRDEPVVLLERVADVDELAVGLVVLHLDVGQRRVAPGTPVDDAVGPVDEALLVEPHEDDPHRPGAALVHREAFAAPVAGGAHLAHLGGDLAARGLLPAPHPLHEGLPADLVAVEALLGQLPLDHVLGGDPGVVGTGQPQGGAPPHPLAPDGGVDERVLEGVAHVERAGDVGRRYDDAERLAVRVDLGAEGARLLPRRIPARLGRGRVVGLGHLGRGHQDLRSRDWRPGLGPPAALR
jgi:hypothetical protein